MTELDQAELDLLGEGPAATDGDHLDEHALLDQTPPPGDDHNNGLNRVKSEELKSEEVDLYDDAIAPSSGEKTVPPTPVRPAQHNGGSTHVSDGKRYCCYIGNLVWWATDADVGLHIKALGIPDLIDMKFFENRTNGQSKGFALLVLGSDASVRTITEQMPQRQIHGQNPVILPYTKASLNRLDEATSKMQSRPDTKQSKKDEACMNMGTIRIGTAGGPTGPPPIMGPRMGPGGPPMMNAAPMGGPAPMGPGGMINRGPVMMGQPVNQGPMMARTMGPPGVGTTIAPVQMGGPVQMGVAGQMTTGPPRPMVGGAVPMQVGQAPPMMQMQSNRPPPGVQFNSGQQPVLGMSQQQMMSQGPPGVRSMNAPPQAPQQLLAPHGAHINPQMFPGVHQQPPVPGAVNDVEFEEIMNRNRTVASSAISRAVADAAGGDRMMIAADFWWLVYRIPLMVLKIKRTEAAVEASIATDRVVVRAIVIASEDAGAVQEAGQALDRAPRGIHALVITKYGADNVFPFKKVLYFYIALLE
ncbi:unnamed protein product [Cylicocyclus nassatus]|uniref:CPSF6/7 RSLD domain-containing protein n=1 Tax=Cylicocyclus nassatus TaxID=53992 RepID=A0AA36M9A3_CYLNA|nr:unnamed protein product [Cylicocyclus nassatus]